VNVKFVNALGGVKLTNTLRLIDHAAQTVTSTTGELKLDYGKGILVINAPRAQGVSGLIHAVDRIETQNLSIGPDMDLGQIIAVPLDNQSLARSRKILLQVMSEEKASEFQTEAVENGVKRVTNIGRDPWLVKEIRGTVNFKRADAATLKVTALDFNGYPVESVGTAENIKLRPSTLYYLIGN
jgi:hypothetical protein